MSLSDKELELLEGYFRNELTEAQKIAFEEIKGKVEIQNELEKLKNLEDAFAQLERKRLKKHLQLLEKQLIETKKIPIYATVWFKAAIILIIPALSLWFYAFATYSDSHLAQSYYLQPVYEVERGNGNAQQQYTSAFELFSNKDYYEVLKVESNEVDVLVLKAHAYYNLRELENALDVLDKVLNQETNDEAEWLKINVLLNQGKVAYVRVLVDKMSLNSKHAYQKQAIKLQKDLRHPLRRLIF